MKKLLLSTAALMLSVVACYGWGQKGHDVVAHIAERHLSEQAAAAVDSILDGYSMVYWANWLDNASHTPEYAYTKTWHYKNVDQGVSYDQAPRNPDGDVVTAITAQIEILQDPSSTHDESALALKILIHLVGDLHQPMHMGHATDLGGNRVKVKYFGRDANLHSVWDSSLVDSAHKWSYTEWADQIDRPAMWEALPERPLDVDNWGASTISIAGDIYETMPEGTQLSYNDVARWTPIIEKQLLQGGLGLAAILNSIYDR